MEDYLKKGSYVILTDSIIGDYLSCIGNLYKVVAIHWPFLRAEHIMGPYNTVMSTLDIRNVTFEIASWDFVETFYSQDEWDRVVKQFEEDNDVSSEDSANTNIVPLFSESAKESIRQEQNTSTSDPSDENL